MNVQATNATQTKERLYTQLAGSISRLAKATSQTADLCENLQYDLLAMRVFAGLDAAKCVMRQQTSSHWELILFFRTGLWQ